MALVRQVAAWAVSAAVAAAAPLAASEARELRIAPATPSAHPANAVLYTRFLDDLPEQSDGRLSAVMLGPEVVSPGQVGDALRSQVAQVGNLAPLLDPAGLPMMALAGQFSLAGTDPQAMAAALTEWTVGCAPCQAEFAAQGLVYLGSGASDRFAFVTMGPLRGPGDLAGLRLRTGGAPWSRLARHLGAEPVEMSGIAQADAIKQGAVDGTMAPLSDLLAYGLDEVAGHVTQAPLGISFATSTFTTAQTAWAELTAEDRAAMIRAATRANAAFIHRRTQEMPALALRRARKAGVSVVQADAELVNAIEEFVIADIAAAGRFGQEELGIQDAPERIVALLALVEKWTAIARDLGHDPERIAARVQAEVWDKIDPASYGG